MTADVAHRWPQGASTLAFAHALALAAAVGATALYGRWLDAATFAQWGMALAVARAGLLLLDGGLKTALLRRPEEPDARSLARITRGSAAVAAALLAAAAGVLALLWVQRRIDIGTALLIGGYAAAYLVCYPPMCVAAARLERAGRFAVVGRAEAASISLEFVLPVLLLVAGAPPAAAFVAAAWVARALRAAWLLSAARAAGLPALAAQGHAVPALLREGAGVQVVAALSMLRDLLHLWLLAPWFGAAWAGHYGLALTACALASQVAVATASRVLLPWLRSGPAHDLDQAWPLVRSQARVLAVLTLPVLALMPAWLAHVDAAWWGARWGDAVALAPWLALRMVAGVGTTAVGAWLMVVQPPWAGAAAHARWTVFEAAVAAVALALGGPLAMAAAMAGTAWAGLWWLLRGALRAPGVDGDARAPALWLELIRTLIARPSAWCALVLAALAARWPQLLLAATCALPLCWLAEAPLRAWLRGDGRPWPQRGALP
jgi:hypothetical protein